MPTEPSAQNAPLSIQKFDKALHDRSAFSCGHGAIDNFLKSSLSDHVKNGMVAAYLATADGDPSVLGFYTLGALAVRADLGPRKWQRRGIPDIPVIYIRAVAVRQDQQGRGLGRALLINAMQRCLGIAEQMGAAAIVLDVFNDAHFDRRWSFYADLGFRPLEDSRNPHRVFIPMSDVRASFLGAP